MIMVLICLSPWLLPPIAVAAIALTYAIQSHNLAHEMDDWDKRYPDRYRGDGRDQWRAEQRAARKS